MKSAHDIFFSHRFITSKYIKSRSDLDTISHLCNLEHLTKLVDVTSDEVQERESLVVLRALVSHLHHLMIALSEGSDT